VNQIKFLGHIIDENGVKANPSRIAALEKLPPPTDLSGVRRILGMLNQLAKFVPHLAGKTEPLHQLLKKNNLFQWTAKHQTTLAASFAC